MSRAGNVQGHVTSLSLQLQEQLTELEHERDLLKESNAKLLSRFGDACRRLCRLQPW